MSDNLLRRDAIAVVRESTGQTRRDVRWGSIGQCGTGCSGRRTSHTGGRDRRDGTQSCGLSGWFYFVAGKLVLLSMGTISSLNFCFVLARRLD